MGFVPEGPPIVDEVPGRVRAALYHVIRDRLRIFPNEWWSEAYQELLRASRRQPAENDRGEHGVRLLLTKADWLEIFEMIESLAALAQARDEEYRYDPSQFERLRAEINRLFGDENVGYQLDEQGRLQLTASREMVEAAAEALSATAAGSYSASAEQLRRALEKLTFRKLDPTNAVKDAVGALEGVVRTRCNGKGDIGANTACLKKYLHPTLVEALVKVEAYRGDMAAHADRPGRTVDVEEAIFVVHICSAAVALLASQKS